MNRFFLQAEWALWFFLGHSIVAPYGPAQGASFIIRLHLFNQEDGSFSPGEASSHAILPGSRPRWPIRGSIVHHTAGGHVPWKGRELVTSLSPTGLNVKPIFLFLCSPFLCSSPSQDWNNWAAFRATRLPEQLLNRDIKSGATISLWPPIQCSFLSLPRPLFWGRDGSSSRLRPCGTMTWHPWYIIYSGSAGPELRL